MTASTHTKLAKLPIVNYERLKARDPTEVQNYIRAATKDGIFFLDLQGPSAKKVLGHLQPLYEAQHNFFSRPSEHKIAYASDIPENGYYKHGDDVETYEISRALEISGKLDLPSDFQAVAKELADVASFSDEALRDLYRLVSTSLSPPSPIAAGDDPKQPGTTNLTLGRSGAPVGTHLIPEHTDSGLLTLLYYEAASLEILQVSTGEWGLVEPVEGLHVIYVGDALSAESNGRIRAAPHRVTQPKENTALVVYLLHPERGPVSDP
ncbi:2og-fe oxygenase family protein [Colletotrichum higginsianum IMI 349063]|uniref:2og-fe oxygenase family protein n=2 Tax=Colletotrichum higginsianum TaxID=80884 RepID=A0A1B7Y0V9_COLHI|nr:2og-fe oxygenase family protein [Colletotrichum higginsianum IMI 349063]OBR05641.1 2og-fe oxygenase family protein [Colletotrichum higginsianum IMI 349063]TIC90769.1 Oxidoreductase vrtI [Colletotrichum higginsianum]